VFLNIQIGWIILKTCDEQFTLTTKKSLHIIFKAFSSCTNPSMNVIGVAKSQTIQSRHVKTELK